MQVAKKVTIAERLRNNKAKAEAKAAKAGVNISLEKAIEDAVSATHRSDASSRVMAYCMETTFGADWFTWTSANARTDNEKATFKAIEGYRTLCREKAIAKGLANPNKPWSDARKVSRDKLYGGTNTRQPKPLDERFKVELSKLYKAAQKEERPTEQELDMSEQIGRMLVKFFGIDLTKLNG